MELRRNLFGLAVLAVLCLSGAASAELPGPLAHWEFDEGSGSTAYDSAGDNDGAVYGAKWVDGVLDGALDFDGADDCVALPDNFPVWLPEYDFTYSLWVCFDAPGSVSGQDVLLDLNHTSSSSSINDIGCNVRRLESGEVGFGFSTITDVDEILYANEVVTEGEWYHIVALRDATTQAIYMNGDLDNSRICSGSRIDYAGGSYDDDGVSIGRITTNNSPDGVFHLDGKMDDVRIYDVALSAGEVEELYGEGGGGLIAHWEFDEGNGAIAYDSAGNNDGVVYGAEWVDGALDGALEFDGVDDYVSVSDDDSLTPASALTISSWVYINQISWPDRTAIVCKYYYGDRGYYLLLGKNLDPDTSTVGMAVAKSPTASGYVTHGTAPLQPGQWYHVATTYEPDHMEVYVNGVEEVDNIDAAIPDSIYNNSQPLYIGYDTDKDAYFDGIIDDVRLYGRVLSAGEIEDLYGQEPDDGLVGRWRFDEGGGSIAYDSAGDNDGTIYGAQWADGILDGALEFDGASDYVDVASSEELKLNSAGAISVWANPRYLHEQSIVNKRGGSAAGNNYENYWLVFGMYERAIVIGDGSDHVYAAIPEEDLSVNTWQHIVGTWDSSEIKIYLNGNLSDAQPNTLGELIRSDVYPVRIARHGNGDWSFDGLIDDVRIYDVALSAEEIGELFGQVTPPGKEYHVDCVLGSDDNDGLSRKTAFFSIQKGIDSAEDGDSVLVWPGVYSETINFLGKAITVQSAGDAAVIEASEMDAVTFHSGEGADSVIKNFVIRNSGLAISANYSSSPTISNLTIVDNDYGIAAYEDSNPDITNCILWDNRDGDMWGCQARYSYVEQEIEPGPVAHWKFDEGVGSIAYDSASSNDGVVYGPQWVDGVLDGALDFDGVDDCVEVSDNPNLRFDGGSPYSLAVWVKAERAVPDFSSILVKGPAYDENYGLYIVEATGAVRLQYSYGGTYTANETLVDSASSVLNSSWHHVVGTFDGSQLRLYINGVLEVTGNSAAGIPDTSTTSLTVGVRAGPLDKYFDGLIDDARIYDRALSTSEVELLFEGGVSGHGDVDRLRPLFASARAGDHHLLSESGRYWPEHDVWVLDKVSSPCIDGGDPAIEPSGEPMPNGGAMNMGAYGGTEYASMSEWPIFSDYDRSGRSDFGDFAIFCDEWLLELPWVGGGS